METFKPINTGIVTMYNCGLTVYDYAHIGNLRSYVFADILRRYLEYSGYKVWQVINFTDVGHMVGDADASMLEEDKMALAAKREKKTVWDIANFYIEAALKDFRVMNFEEPEARPRATEHIKEIIEMVQKLIENGYAYVANGSVYFDISKFKDYGKLSCNTIEELEAGAGGRVEKNPDKKSQLDFALWIKDPEHVMRWTSPWSIGYPGWHIECSAMSRKYLGDTIDIHTGGEDNIFPHHDCEIAQSEGSSGKKFVHYWMHVRHLMVDGEKMSKSKGNFYTLKDITKKGYSPAALRFLLISAHHRSQLNFTWEGMDAAEKTLNSLADFMARLDEVTMTYGRDMLTEVAEAEEKFKAAMDDDLSTPGAIATVFDFVGKANFAMEGKAMGRDGAKKVKAAMLKFDKVLGILSQEKEAVPAEVKKLAQEREAARKKKDWAVADKLRNAIKELGWIVEDTLTGFRLRKST